MLPRTEGGLLSAGHYHFSFTEKQIVILKRKKRINSFTFFYGVNPSGKSL